jgi:hypothetical protein
MVKTQNRRLPKRNNERVIDISQNLALCQSVSDLLSLNEMLLLQHFHGVNLASILLSHLHDFAKAPWSEVDSVKKNEFW